jgi:hypothetical protein
MFGIIILSLTKLSITKISISTLSTPRMSRIGLKVIMRGFINTTTIASPINKYWCNILLSERTGTPFYEAMPVFKKLLTNFV